MGNGQKGKVTHCIANMYCGIANCQLLKLQTPILALLLSTAESACHSCIPTRPGAIALGSRPSARPEGIIAAYAFSSVISDSSLISMKEAGKLEVSCLTCNIFSLWFTKSFNFSLFYKINADLLWKSRMWRVNINNNPNT